MRTIAQIIVMLLVVSILVASLACAIRPQQQIPSLQVQALSGIESTTTTLTATGDAGAATGTATTVGMVGLLLDVYINYGTVSDTTDITLTYSSPSYSGNILAVSNANTDALFVPRTPVVNASNSAYTDGYDHWTLNGTVGLACSNSTSGTVAVVTIRYLRP